MRSARMSRRASRPRWIRDLTVPSETLVISGFTRSREVRERVNSGLRGGWFGRRTVVTQKRVEILILLTPKVL